MNFLPSPIFSSVRDSRSLSVEFISGSEGNEARTKVADKVQKFISNIENDIAKEGVANFDELKSKFASKYKNLPAKFHLYLDEVIKWKLK